MIVHKQDSNTYKSILKSTSVFGFAQFAKILIGVVSSKFIALFLGVSGIGFVGLINNTLAIIGSITGFGINVVAVRELSLESTQSSIENLSKKFKIIQKWCLITGLFGGFLTIIFSKLLSQFTFGDSKYYFWFILLSINFVINALTISKSALLQSKRMIKQIALTNVFSSFFICVFIVPIYYYFEFQAIIPVIIISSLITFLVNFYFTRKIKIIQIEKINFNELIYKIKPLFKLGFLLSINVIFGQICNFLIRMYLKSNQSNLEVLGFYEVSSVLLLSYVGMIFGAMSTDFYPRLTSIAENNQKVKSLVNDQIEIGLLLITPLILLFYCFAPFIINVLYSRDFLNVIEILKFGLLAIIVKSIIWPLAFVILSKGENKLYFKQEILGDFLNVSNTILLYNCFGLQGIGLAMLINYILYGLYVYFILKQKFDFGIRKNTFSIIIKSFILGTIASLSGYFLNSQYDFLLLLVLSILSITYTFKELNSRIDLYGFYHKFKKKYLSKFIL